MKVEPGQVWKVKWNHNQTLTVIIHRIIENDLVGVIIAHDTLGKRNGTYAKHFSRTHLILNNTNHRWERLS